MCLLGSCKTAWLNILQDSQFGQQRPATWWLHHRAYSHSPTYALLFSASNPVTSQLSSSRSETSDKPLPMSLCCLIPFRLYISLPHYNPNQRLYTLCVILETYHNSSLPHACCCFILILFGPATLQLNPTMRLFLTCYKLAVREPPAVHLWHTCHEGLQVHHTVLLLLPFSVPFWPRLYRRLNLITRPCQ